MLPSSEDCGDDAGGIPSSSPCTKGVGLGLISVGALLGVGACAGELSPGTTPLPPFEASPWTTVFPPLEVSPTSGPESSMTSALCTGGLPHGQKR